MPTKKFLEAVKSDSALKNDLTSAFNESLIKVAKKHGYEISSADLNAKDHKSTGSVGCVSTTKTLVCTV